MITFFNKNPNGLFEADTFQNNCWTNATAPTEAETLYLLDKLQIPEAFYNDIADIDERPRIEIENGWTLIIIRIPFKSSDEKLPFNTAPLGFVFKADIFVSICFEPNEVLTDFVNYTQRKKIEITSHYDFVLKCCCRRAFGFRNI